MTHEEIKAEIAKLTKDAADYLARYERDEARWQQYRLAADDEGAFQNWRRYERTKNEIAALEAQL